MKSLIKFLVMNVVMFLVTTGLITGVVFVMRGKPLPYEDRIARIMAPPDSTAVLDTMMTEADLALQAEQERLAAIQAREDTVRTAEARLAVQKDSLAQVQTQLAMVLREREQTRNERVIKLARVYESMRPADAAAIVAELDNQTIRVILDNMNERQAARLLGEIPPDRAVEITQSITQQ